MKLPLDAMAVNLGGIILHQPVSNRVGIEIIHFKETYKNQNKHLHFGMAF